MSKNSLYTNTSNSLDFYSSTTTGTEPDMREEMINTLDGVYPEVSKKQTGLLRRARLDSNNNLIDCPCVDNLTGEQDKDRFCPICYSSLYYWDEEEITFYKVLVERDAANATRDQLSSPGLINVPIVVFYVRYNANITRKDKIITVELNTDGSVVSPWKRTALYRIETAWDYRSDNAKLEYWKLFTHQEDVKHLNQPSYQDV